MSTVPAQRTSITMENEKLEKPLITKESNESQKDVAALTTSSSFIERKGKLLIGLIIGIVLLTIIILMFFGLTKTKEKESGKMPPPEPANVLLATVGNRKIYRNDVRGIALEQYLASGIDSKIMKISLDAAVERAVLDNEANTKSIVVDEGKNRVEYYENLKNAIMLREVGTVTANTIGYWVPAFHDIYPQKPEYQQMRDLQSKVFGEAIVSLGQGKTTYDVGKSILERYPVYKDQLSVNSYRIAKTDDITLMQKPVVYQYLVNDSNKALMNFIFSLNKGQTKIYTWPDGEGGEIVQVVDKSFGGKVTYDQWLKEKERTVVYEQGNVNSL